MDLHTSTAGDADPRVAQPYDRTTDIDKAVDHGGRCDEEVETTTSLSRGVSNSNSEPRVCNDAHHLKPTNTKEGALDSEKGHLTTNGPTGQHVYPNHLVTFSLNDPEDPKNFSNFRKWAITISMGYMTLVSGFSC